MSASIEIKQFLLGPMENYCYVISDSVSKEAIIVDPAWDIETVKNYLEENSLKLKGYFVSHYHPDHCGGHLWGHDIPGVAEFLEFIAAPILCHKDELEGLHKITGIEKKEFKTLASGDTINLGDHTIKGIHTPGHTPGSMCLLVDGQSLFAGDTLFINGCGRVDLPGGSAEQLYDSLQNKLMKLPGSTILFPGHAYAPQKNATFHEILQLNPFLKNLENKDEWIKIRS